jgi:hypothetical protein
VQVLGCALEVRLGEEWFRGIVAAFCRKRMKHTIYYDDGDTRRHDMLKKLFVLLDDCDDPVTQLGERLVQGILVKKFPRSGQPRPRTLWITDQGLLCLGSAKATSSTKHVAIEDVSRVAVGSLCSWCCCGRKLFDVLLLRTSVG